MKISLHFILLYLLFTLPVLAQTDQSKQIAGIVKDQDGVSLPGVSIAVMGNIRAISSSGSSPQQLKLGAMSG